MSFKEIKLVQLHLAHIEYVIDYACRGLGISRDGFFRTHGHNSSTASLAKKLIISICVDKCMVTLEALAEYFCQGTTTIYYAKTSSRKVREGKSKRVPPDVVEVFCRLYDEYKVPEPVVVKANLARRNGRDPRSMNKTPKL